MELCIDTLINESEIIIKPVGKLINRTKPLQDSLS